MFSSCNTSARGSKVQISVTSYYFFIFLFFEGTGYLLSNKKQVLQRVQLRKYKNKGKGKEKG